MEESLTKLYEQYRDKFINEEIVLGDGDISSKYMMIGEAPGKDEVIQQKPFVGLAGGNLKEFIEYINLTREDLFVTNAIKYRLFKINEKTNRKSNRPAKVSEIKVNRPFLMKEIEIVKPNVIITLGNVPLKAVLGDNKITIGKVHGQKMEHGESILFPLYHPASIIYNKSLKDKYYKDLDKLKEIIL